MKQSKYVWKVIRRGRHWQLIDPEDDRTVGFVVFVYGGYWDGFVCTSKKRLEADDDPVARGLSFAAAKTCVEERAAKTRRRRVVKQGDST